MHILLFRLALRWFWSERCFQPNQGNHRGNVYRMLFRVGHGHSSSCPAWQTSPLWCPLFIFYLKGGIQQKKTERSRNATGDTNCDERGHNYPVFFTLTGGRSNANETLRMQSLKRVPFICSRQITEM